MKKIIAVLLVAFMLLVPFTALAHIDNDFVGEIPKTATAPVIDGVKDNNNIWDKALHIPVRTSPEGAATGMGGGADAWLLWDDGNFYIFMNIDLEDAGNLFSPDDYDEIAKSESWNLTCIEFMLDMSNEGSWNGYVMKIVVNDRGQPELRIPVGGIVEDVDSYIQVGSVKGSNNYTVEVKWDMAACLALADSGDDEHFLQDVGELPYGADKEIGIYIYSQEKVESGASVPYISVPSDRSGNNNPLVYDYIKLSANTVSGDVVESVSDSVEEAVENADENSGEEVAATTAAPVKPAAPRTGDSTAVMFIVLAIVLSAAVVFAKKAKKNI